MVNNKLEVLLKQMHNVLEEHKSIATANMSPSDKNEAYQDCLQDLFLVCCNIDKEVHTNE